VHRQLRFDRNWLPVSNGVRSTVTAVSSPSAEVATRAIAVLRERGIRVTAPRRIIIEALAAAGRAHLSATDLADRVRQDHPEVNASTVYRCLDLLREQHVVSHSHVPGGATVYHLVDDRHQHLVCAGCGRVIDVALGPFEDLARALDEGYGFEVHLGHDALTGRCADCR
jgi:Fur family ferric uptake transcriptional regulator